MYLDSWLLQQNHFLFEQPVENVNKISKLFMNDPVKIVSSVTKDKDLIGVLIEHYQVLILNNIFKLFIDIYLCL